MSNKQDKYHNWVASDIKPPYIKNMEVYGISDMDEKYIIFGKMFNGRVTSWSMRREVNSYGFYRLKYDITITPHTDHPHINGEIIYKEDDNGHFEVINGHINRGIYL